MKRLLVIVSLTLAWSLQAQDDGTPFGQIGDADVDRLAEFAKKSDFDLKSEIERVYKKDEGTLARLFKFSIAFKTLDANACTSRRVARRIAGRKGMRIQRARSPSPESRSMPEPDSRRTPDRPEAPGLPPPAVGRGADPPTVRSGSPREPGSSSQRSSVAMCYPRKPRPGHRH